MPKKFYEVDPCISFVLYKGDKTDMERKKRPNS